MNEIQMPTPAQHCDVRFLSECWRYEESRWQEPILIWFLPLLLPRLQLFPAQLQNIFEAVHFVDVRANAYEAETCRERLRR
jgi:hypothetical protein